MSATAESIAPSTRDEKQFERVRLVRPTPKPERSADEDEHVSHASTSSTSPLADPIDTLPMHDVIQLLRTPVPRHGAHTRASAGRRVQEVHGNRFVQRLVNAEPVQRQCACGGTCAKCREVEAQRSWRAVPSIVQRWAATGAPEDFDRIPTGGGEYLDPATRRSLEAHFGADLADVRIHTSAEAAASATSLDALAYTSGRDIYFGVGMYSPASTAGQRLLAHEVAHVVQQDSGKEPTIATKTSRGVKIGAPDDTLETEAERAAEKFMSGSLTDEEQHKKRESPGTLQRFAQRLVALRHVAQKAARHSPTARPLQNADWFVGASDGSLEHEAKQGPEALASKKSEGEMASGDSSEIILRSGISNLTTNPVIQRDGDANPANLDEALRTGDSEKLEPFRPFSGITSNQLLSLVNLIVTEKWVSWREESILEEAWQAYGKNTSIGSLTASDYSLWKSCENRGADVKNVFWLRDLRSQFATEVRELARVNLEKNSEAINAEAMRLGVGVPGAASPEADAAIKEQQKQAASIEEAKTALGRLSSIDVGYTEPPRTKGSDQSQFGGTAPPGGLTDPLARGRASFDPEKRPAFPNEPGDGMLPYEEVAAVHRTLAESVAETLNRNPALYALVAVDTNKPLGRGGSSALAAPGQSPAEARAKVAAALSEVTDNISKTRAAIDDQSLGFEAMLPVQERLYSTHKVYSKPFAREAAKAFVQERAGDAASANSVISLSTMALILAVEIGTAGAATPLVGALIGLTASGAAATDSWNQWARLDTAARSTVSDTGAVVRAEQAEQAFQAAQIATIMALLDVYSVGKAARAASLARVAGLEAGLAAKKELASLATRSIPEQKAILERVIEEEGALAAVRDSGRPADELIAIVGKESPAGQRLAALAGGVSQAAVDDMARIIPQLGQKTAAEATALVNQSIDLLGPAQTLQRAGGWSSIESAVAEDKGVLSRLESWRKALIDQAENATGEAGGVEGGAAARSFLAERTGLPADAIETALGIIVMVASEIGDDTEVSSSAEGSFSHQPIDLEAAASETAAQHNVAYPVQRQAVASASPPLPLTEKQLDALSPDAFEEVMRAAIGSGYFSADGLPRMSVLEMKLNTSGHGLDGVGFRRRGDLVDVYKFEFKQVTTGSTHVPELHPTSMGVQGGQKWSMGNFEKLMTSDDPVALETLDTLRRNLRRYFGSQYSESLLLEAFGYELARAPLTIITRAHASLDLLIPQLRGLARSLGRGRVRIIPVRGRV